MNKLWSFGDSWVQGIGINRYEHGFTKHLSDELGLIDYNFGMGSASNKYIVDILSSHVSRISKDDCVLVSFTTPHRDDPANLIPNFLKYIDKTIEFLDEIGCYYKLTQAFNPIFGYDYIVEDRDYPKFIEWGKPNNTLLDIITNNWLGDKINIFMDEGKTNWESWGMEKSEIFCEHDGKHPSENGHKVIAKKLLEYMGDYND